ncbi:TIR domain-containing protein [Mesorhizobium sp.]|uniref:TIR domain-containing protein n=1 Tax=Mesorhizobium sp. TaxID=1871066 RepID=UPI0012077814|nr:TIR domain-containing protein [Mesorhizobium sp.]TIS47300.1 MAG: TIR domain-containing protein [Mesorhizobium sp.]
MSDKVCNVFISHVHEDDARLQALKDLLAKNGCVARDSSINSDRPNDAKNPDYIKREILSPRIEWAGTVVVLITPDTKHSDWVNWEIEYAHKLGKRIVGVWDHGEHGCEPPEALDEYANAVVPWRAEQIIDAIFGKIVRLRRGPPCASMAR